MKTTLLVMENIGQPENLASHLEQLVIESQPRSPDSSEMHSDKMIIFHAGEVAVT